jgi:hypothetical protein
VNLSLPPKILAPMARALSEQELFRREALTELRKLGIEPFPAAEYITTHTSKQVLTEFKDDEDYGEVVMAGRIMTKRIMGKASFACYWPILPARFSCTSTVMYCAPEMIKHCTIPYSKNCWILVILLA